jgi:3-phenylpropionate/trans-cinnamate dioxygenase ferredoxin subunit
MLFEKKYNWVKIADSAKDIPGLEQGIGEIVFDGRNICLVNWNQQLHAFSGNCPHAGAPLAKGELDHRGILLCPRHGYSFNIRNGLNTSGEGFKLSCWPVEERSDGIFIGMRIV